MPNETVEVVIVGAGPVGLALACDLVRHKVDFRIIDKAPAHFPGSKAKGIQPRTLEVMDDFGIVDEVLGNGRFHIPFRGYDGRNVRGDIDMHEGRNPTPDRPYASVLITPQFRTEEALRGLLENSGSKVDLSTELTALEQDKNGITAVLRVDGGEERVRCRYLVACDGGRSFVRKFLEVPFEGETWKDERMYVADVRLRGLNRDVWHSWPSHPDGWVALCPLPSTDLFQLQAQIPPSEEHEPSLELFQQILDKRTDGCDIQLTDAPWMSLYRVNVRMISRYREGNVFLAGDAAHVHPPAGGQGMNTGIQDAYNLGWKLASVLKGAPVTLLDSYEEERLPVAAAVLGFSSRLYKHYAEEVANTQHRDDSSLQLGISYKGMSLSRTAGQTSFKLAAGDRAPDAPGTDIDGRALRLFDLLRGPRFTLLRLLPIAQAELGDLGAFNLSVVGITRTPGAAIDGFVDSAGHFADAYAGESGDMLLIRPDGYVGWLGSQHDSDDLASYLSRVAARS